MDFSYIEDTAVLSVIDWYLCPRWDRMTRGIGQESVTAPCALDPV